MIFPVLSPVKLRQKSRLTNLVKTQIYTKTSSETISVIAAASQATSRQAGQRNTEMNTVGLWL